MSLYSKIKKIKDTINRMDGSVAHKIGSFGRRTLRDLVKKISSIDSVTFQNGSHTHSIFSKSKHYYTPSANVAYKNFTINYSPYLDEFDPNMILVNNYVLGLRGTAAWTKSYIMNYGDWYNNEYYAEILRRANSLLAQSNVVPFKYSEGELVFQDPKHVFWVFCYRNFFVDVGQDSKLQDWWMRLYWCRYIIFDRSKSVTDDSAYTAVEVDGSGSSLLFYRKALLFTNRYIVPKTFEPNDYEPGYYYPDPFKMKINLSLYKAGSRSLYLYYQGVTATIRILTLNGSVLYCKHSHSIDSKFYGVHTVFLDFSNIFGNYTELIVEMTGFITGLGGPWSEDTNERTALNYGVTEILTPFPKYFRDASYAFAHSAITTVPRNLFENCYDIVDSVHHMFYDCKNIKTTIDFLFEKCLKITSVDSLYESCSHLETITSNCFLTRGKIKSARYTFAGISLSVVLNAELTPNFADSITDLTGYLSRLYSGLEPGEYPPGSTSPSIYKLHINLSDMPNLRSVEGFLYGSNRIYELDIETTNVPRLTDYNSFFERSTAKIINMNFEFQSWDIDLTNLCKSCAEARTIEFGWKSGHVWYASAVDYAFSECVNMTSQGWFHNWSFTSEKSTHEGCYRNCKKMVNYADIPSDWK